MKVKHFLKVRVCFLSLAPPLRCQPGQHQQIKWRISKVHKLIGRSDSSRDFTVQLKTYSSHFKRNATL